ncbi:MAG TPA: hypothetical protein VFR11_21040 [Micromonosporaceae bacterium]|jgi:hypothetical protein|nr:hypothetical protein [Micromonosporaceae bacterium]
MIVGWLATVDSRLWSHRRGGALAMRTPLFAVPAKPAMTTTMITVAAAGLGVAAGGSRV